LVLREGLLLSSGPVLVESSKGVGIEFLGPDSSKGSESSGGIDVSDDSDNSHGGSFDDSNSLNNFFLVEF